MCKCVCFSVLFTCSGGREERESSPGEKNEPLEVVITPLVSGAVDLPDATAVKWGHGSLFCYF